VSGTPIDDTSSLGISLIFYAALEGAGEMQFNKEDKLHMTGKTPVLGDFKIYVNEGTPF
jgi:Glycosyl hydrolase family 63 N-terminal domain